MTNLIETDKKAISVVSNESKKEFNDAVKEHEKIVGNIVQGSAEKMIVLNFVLRKLLKLTFKHKWVEFKEMFDEVERKSFKDENYTGFRIIGDETFKEIKEKYLN